MPRPAGKSTRWEPTPYRAASLRKLHDQAVLQDQAVDLPRKPAIMAPLANPDAPRGGGHRMKTLRFRHLLSALAIAALVLPGAAPADAQSKGTIKIASQSPLSGGQSALGEGIKL